MTRREAEALDQAKRVLLLAERAPGTCQVEKYLQVVDKWLAIADRSKSR